MRCNVPVREHHVYIRSSLAEIGYDVVDLQDLPYRKPTSATYRVGGHTVNTMFFEERKRMLKNYSEVIIFYYILASLEKF